MRRVVVVVAACRWPCATTRSDEVAFTGAIAAGAGREAVSRRRPALACSRGYVRPALDTHMIHGGRFHASDLLY